MNMALSQTIIRSARVHSIASRRWQSRSMSMAPLLSAPHVTAGLTGGLTVLLGGFAWYHFSGTRQMVNLARDGANKAQELKDKFKEVASDAAGNPSEMLSYLRSATTTLIPGSAPFLGKIFDQIEQISKEHGDEVKKIFEAIYHDFEKLSKEGGLDSGTAMKAVDILQKRVRQIQELSGDLGDEKIKRSSSGDRLLKGKFQDQYSSLKDLATTAKEKAPEAQKLIKETGADLSKIYKESGISDESLKEAHDLLKEKAEEAKKLGTDVLNEAKKKRNHS